MELNKKYARTTHAQLEAYINFIDDHPEFLTGKNSPEAPQQMQKLWDELSVRLNSLLGPARTASLWKENLRNWRKQLKCKARKVIAESRRTGGGVNNATGLNAFEERALQSLGTVGITGLDGEDLGFGGESVLRLPITGCMSPIQIVESVTISPAIEEFTQHLSPSFLIAQSPSPTTATMQAAAEATPQPAAATPLLSRTARRRHRKGSNGLPGYLQEEGRLRREEMEIRREELQLKREKMEREKEQHNQMCSTLNVLTEAVNKLNALLSCNNGK